MWKSLCLALVLVVVPVLASAVTYTWVDDQGTMNFSDDLSSVPTKFRKKVKILGGDDVAPEAELAPAGDAPSAVPAVESPVKTPAKMDVPASRGQEKKELLYGGKTEAAWRQEIVYARAELKSARDQLADTKARLNDTSRMSRSEYLGIQQQIKSIEASITGMEGRYAVLESAARNAEVPESVFR
jgi:hypothetical protein